ncbi:glutathione S-transferase family protein [Roseofilum casamattae]|uniref:Glutathione S-transferase family protein n=1 Tax=Roseofilum casamattae BLCC-M143 TaxID=3022442 RepID=A0ABT7BS89_9CYAN|nr:glutathione S-transferase family protein [Roseofilum casamattae]MDJ1181940.1 glutathione S-transferase family protein [Roseofilum casamattae BLCC-M143]
MLKFYYHPLSPIARRVWLALLEKSIPFELILVDLRGEQMKPEFLAINPFHHVPVICDRGLQIIESLAILDYLEQQYPHPSLSPQSPEALAKMRMVQCVTMSELMPKLAPFVYAELEPTSSDSLLEHIDTVLQFFSQELGSHSYFGGDGLNLADIVAGATVPLFCRLGISLTPYPNLEHWHQSLIDREAWQQTSPPEDQFQLWKRWVQRQVKQGKTSSLAKT